MSLMRLIFQGTETLPSRSGLIRRFDTHLANGAHNQLQSFPAMYPLIVEGCLPQIFIQDVQWHQQHSWVRKTL